jgi:hypothetical protein
MDVIWTISFILVVAIFVGLLFRYSIRDWWEEVRRR